MKNALIFNTLRALFTTGFAILFILLFMPFMRFKGLMVAEKDFLTVLEEIQYLYAYSPLLALLIVIIILAIIAFIILALTYPKLWVFRTGAIIASLALLLGIFFPSPEGMEIITISRVLCFIGGLFGFTGFFIKPKKKT